LIADFIFEEEGKKLNHALIFNKISYVQPKCAQKGDIFYFFKTCNKEKEMFFKIITI